MKYTTYQFKLHQLITDVQLSASQPFSFEHRFVVVYFSDFSVVCNVVKIAVTEAQFVCVSYRVTNINSEYELLSFQSAAYWSI